MMHIFKKNLKNLKIQAAPWLPLPYWFQTWSFKIFLCLNHRNDTILILMVPKWHQIVTCTTVVTFIQNDLNFCDIFLLFIWSPNKHMLQVTQRPRGNDAVGELWAEGRVFAVGDCNYGCIGNPPDWIMAPVPKVLKICLGLVWKIFCLTCFNLSLSGSETSPRIQTKSKVVRKNGAAKRGDIMWRCPSLVKSKQLTPVATCEPWTTESQRTLALCWKAFADVCSSMLHFTHLYPFTKFDISCLHRVYIMFISFQKISFHHVYIMGDMMFMWCFISFQLSDAFILSIFVHRQVAAQSVSVGVEGHLLALGCWHVCHQPRSSCLGPRGLRKRFFKGKRYKKGGTKRVPSRNFWAFCSIILCHVFSINWFPSWIILGVEKAMLASWRAPIIRKALVTWWTGALASRF